MVPQMVLVRERVLGCGMRPWMTALVLCAALLNCFLGTLPVHGQLNGSFRDSMRERLATTTDPSTRLAPLTEMSWSYLFSKEALPYLAELDSLTRILENSTDHDVRTSALSVRSRFFYQRGYQAKFRKRIAQAQKDFREAIRYADLAKDTLAMANGMNAMGVSYAALHMPAQALHWYEKELDLVLSTSERSAMYTAHIRQHKADALMQLGRFNEAEAALGACDTMEAGRHALTLMGRGHLAAFRGDTAQALALMTRAGSVVDRSDQPWDGITVLEPFARFQLHAGHPEQALRTAKAAIDLAVRIGDHAAQAGCLVIAGQAAMQLGDLHHAERSFTEALAIAKDHGYIGLSRETGDDGCMVRAAELLRDLYKAQGRTKDALDITDLWVAWKDSLHTIEGREELLRFDLEQAALTDSILDTQRLDDATSTLRKEVTEERKGRQRLLIWGGVALASTVFLLAFILGRRKREQLVLEHTLQRSKDDQMIRDLKLRERMSEDLHEELGAGLSALKLWTELDLAEEQDPRKKELLRDRTAMADDLVASLRQIIWAMNSPTGTLKNLVDYLNDSAHLFCAKHAIRLHVHVDQEWPSIPLSADQRRHAYLVLKEALTNVVKHSGANTVDLHLHWHNGFHFEIQDNGKGVQSDVQRLPGNGLRAMQRRINGLGGRIEFHGRQGMRVVVFIPLSTHE